ncbi:hypothetical protein MKK88_10695 [Methylobacterium sp. E-005]|nr:hypothetical protein [Methylobacterium sp. E-005]
MILAGAACLASAEREYQKAFPQSPMLADIVTRLNGPGIDFYRDFYYPAGGLQRILVARSPATLKNDIQSASQWIELSVEMTRVCHFHADKLENRSKFLRASYASAGSAVSYLIGEGKRDKMVINSLLASRITNKTVDALNCQKRANEFSQSAALIYAAYSITYASENLLNVICRGEASYQKHGHLIAEWARRAAYVAEHIISPMYKRAGKFQQIEYLLDIPPLAFTGPDYGEATEGVKRAFAVMRPRSSNLPDDLQGPRKPKRKVCWS